MEFCKKILDWTFLIAKIIFAIVLIIIGVKLIIFLLAPLFLINIPVFSFTSFDWNPLATIIGAVLTGIITWFAIYKTSQLDKKNRLYEFKYKHYIESLDELKKYILPIERITFYFEQNSSCSVNKNLNNSVLNKDFEIRQFDKIYSHLCNINSRFKNKTSGFDEAFESFKKVYDFLKKQVIEHNYYLEINDEKYKKEFIKNSGQDYITYNGEEFLQTYKDYSGKDYNVLKMINTLDNLKNIIEEEFKLDEK